MFEKRKTKDGKEKRLNRRDFLKMGAGVVLGGVIGAKGIAETVDTSVEDMNARELSPNELIEEYQSLNKRFESLNVPTFKELETTLQSLGESSTVSIDELKPFANAVSEVNERMTTANGLLVTIQEHFRSSEFKDIPPLNRAFEKEITALEPKVVEIEANPLYTLYA